MSSLPPPPPPSSPPPPPPAGPFPHVGPPSARRTSGLAVASLVLGIVGIFTCFLLLPSILAVVFGGLSLRQIDHQTDQLAGRGLAIAGIVCGAAILVAFVLALVFGEVSYDAPNLR